MNGARTTFMRRGYLLTALAAAVLLAASVETAEAQRVTIGFVESGGMVSEKAFLHANSLEDPQRITVRVQGLAPGGQRVADIGSSLGNVTITPKAPVFIARVGPTGYETGAAGINAIPSPPVATAAGAQFTIDSSHFEHSDEVVLVVTQSVDGTPDGNWLEEMVELQLEVEDAATVSNPASVRPDIYTLTVMESHVAPVAKFQQPDFTLSEQSTRTVQLDISSGIRGVPLPSTTAGGFAGAAGAFPGMLSVRVKNHGLVRISTTASAMSCPGRTDALYNRVLFLITLDGDADGTDDWTAANFSNTGVLTTASSIYTLANTSGAAANLSIEGCGDGAGISDPYITLSVMSNGLSGRVAGVPTYGSIGTGPPLMVSIDSDEAAPTLSFSPTDVEIDEGGSTDTVLLAEGPNASAVGMVKLAVEGDAMVDLYQDGEMLDEMGGYVTVDLGGNSSARLMAMSTSDPDLMDGDMAYKAWKLMDDSAQGVNIGDGYWFKVDVRGSTAVPALPLVGQLLLALFLMAGGSRLYRRNRG